MAKTNWQDPKTSEIISPHISGLQEAVGKIEESIGIESVAETDIPLSEVYIADDDRFRIFQAPEGKRNWLLSPSPVIKKNGNVITEGFEIEYGGGAIVFTTPVLETDTLTADATYTKKVEGKGLSTNDYTDNEKQKNQDNADNIVNLIQYVGDLENLTTEEKSNIVGALNEIDNDIKTHKADDASTTTKGHVQLNNTVTSTSTTQAATANAVKTAYDKGNHSHPYAPSTHTHTKSQVGLGNVENYRQARSAQGYTIVKDGTDGTGIINFKTS